MFSNFQDILKALQGGALEPIPGQMGGAMPTVGPNAAVPLPPATPMTPATPLPAATAAPAADPAQTASIPANIAQYASFANPNAPSAPGLKGPFPEPPKPPQGMLAPVGKALGLNDGMGGPTAFGGLLSFKDDDSKQALLRGMLATSAGVLKAAGPSEKPHSIGQDLAEGMNAGVKSYGDYSTDKQQQAFARAQAGKLEADNAKTMYEIEQGRKMADARERYYKSRGGMGFNGGSSTGATSVAPLASAPQVASVARIDPVTTQATASAPAPQSDLAMQINRQRKQMQQDYDFNNYIGKDENARQIFTQMNFLDNQAAEKGLVWNGEQFVAAPGYNEGVQRTAYAEGSGRQAGTESQIRTDDQRNYEYGKEHPDFVTPQQKQAAADARAKDQAAFKDEQDLRKEYTASPVYQRYDNVRASFDRIQSSANQDNGAGDLGIIYGYMKMLDPGSVVREGEFATAEQAQGVPTQVLNLYNKLVNGERLTADQRSTFVSAAQDLYSKEADKLTELNTRFTDIAGAHSFDPSRVVVQPKAYEPFKPVTRSPTSSGQPVQEWKPRSSAPGPSANVVTITGDADFAKLPSGTKFRGPSDPPGVTRTKP